MWEHYPLNYFSKKLKRTVIDMSKILETQPEREAENDVIAISGNCCINGVRNSNLLYQRCRKSSILVVKCMSCALCYLTCTYVAPIQKRPDLGQ